LIATGTSLPAAITRSSLLPVLLGLIALYLPIYAQLAESLWQQDHQAHAPLVAVIVALLFWQLRKPLGELTPRPANWTGSLIMGAGLALLLAGHGSGQPFLAMLSQPFVLGGLLLLLLGPGALRLAWFPLLYLLFMLPLPGLLVDALTAQLKALVSLATEELLYRLDYPIARNGVVLTVGSYRLLVADACSGLHSMISLSAFGSLFVYWRGRSRWLHNGLMLLAILPIAVAANLARVILLVLVTYHFGDHWGRQLHELTGVSVFVVALLLLFALDALLWRLGASR
jgi:exosortase B